MEAAWAGEWDVGSGGREIVRVLVAQVFRLGECLDEFVGCEMEISC